MAARCSFGPLHLAPVPTFLIYLVLDVGLITSVMWLYFRALQISPLSMCIPFLAFTPVFPDPSAYIILGQMPAPIKLLGVVLIVVGSLAMHRRLFAVRLAGAGAVHARREGQPLHADGVVHLRHHQPAGQEAGEDERRLHGGFAYGVGLCLAFYLLGKMQKGGFRAPPSRNNVKWMSLAGLFDAVSLLFQLASYAYIRW